MKVPALKLLILRLLEEGPKSGYELLREVEELLGSSYPGSVYPILRWWESRGFVKKGEKYELTEGGREFLRELEDRREKYMEMVKKDLMALSLALGDEEMKKIASYLPLREKIGRDGLILLARVLDALLECGEEAKEKLRRELSSLCIEQSPSR